ncbi:hypothetical protein DA2_2952 [Desulfovibrio sp. A2]|nr:hypothetical protein DA2_2952 [Desulfovibrio sp. A2]
MDGMSGVSFGSGPRHAWASAAMPDAQFRAQPASSQGGTP